MLKKAQIRLISHLKKLYSKNVNLIQYMNSNEEFKEMSLQQKVLLSYDLQSGSYTKAYQSELVSTLKHQGGTKIAKILNNLDISTVLDAGTGEGTTLADIILNVEKNISFAAFDISLSRLLYAQKFLISKSIILPYLFTSDLLNISLASSSTDLIMTFHAVEPNGGQEDAICQELHRVSRKYALLIEPSWEFADLQQKNRMEEHGYIKNLPEYLKKAGFQILVHEPWGLDVNPINKAAIILAKKRRICIFNFSRFSICLSIN